jgi:hypothetical protein
MTDKAWKCEVRRKIKVGMDSIRAGHTLSAKRVQNGSLQKEMGQGPRGYWRLISVGGPGYYVARVAPLKRGDGKRSTLLSYPQSGLGQRFAESLPARFARPGNK